MANSDMRITINGDISQFELALGELRAFIEQSKLELTDRFLEIILGLFSREEFFQKLFAFTQDNSSAGTGKILMRLEPTEFFWGFFAAVRARDIESYIVYL